MKIRTKLGIVLLAVSLLVVISTGVFMIYRLDTFFYARAEQELRTQAGELEYVVRSQVNPDSSHYAFLQQLVHRGGVRLTLIRGDGTVIFESDEPEDRLSSLENHLTRPEIQHALRSDTGTASRQSATLGIEMLYYAIRLNPPPGPENPYREAAVLRVGIPLTSVDAFRAQLRTAMALAGVTTLLIAVVLTLLLSRQLTASISAMGAIATKIRQGDLNLRLPVRSRDEIGLLGETLNSMINRLNADIEQLRRLERVRTEFLGNVSHELRTPIFAIQGMLETLLNGALEDHAVNRRFVERSLDNTRRLNTLLGDLIEISRIESGEMKMSFRYFPLGELLSQAVADLQPLAEQQSVTLRLIPAPETLSALGDKDRLKQVMSNLIENAIKYNRPGGSVTVSSDLQDDRVRVSVTDTGVGIAPDHIPRIFERFYRVDKERSREAGGTGLGLAIVKHILEAHGTTPEVRSTVGAGSTFSFTLRT